jgi:hypothetical protein
MPKRTRGNNLERWEIALVKAMLSRGGYNDQDILAYFTRPTRSINHRVINEVLTGARKQEWVGWRISHAGWSKDAPHSSVKGLFSAFCLEIVRSGGPLWRSSLGLEVLHPEVLKKAGR